MREMNQVNDIPIDAGIFHLLYELYGESIPWDTLKFNAVHMNVMYSYHSGEKILAYPIQRDLFSEVTLNRQRVAVYIWGMFHDKWSKYAHTLSLKYDKLANYTVKSFLKSNQRVDSSVNKTKNDRNVETGSKIVDENLVNKNDLVEEGYSNGTNSEVETHNRNEDDINISKVKDILKNNTETNNESRKNVDDDFYGFNSPSGVSVDDKNSLEYDSSSSSNVENKLTEQDSSNEKHNVISENKDNESSSKNTYNNLTKDETSEIKNTSDKTFKEDISSMDETDNSSKFNDSNSFNDKHGLDGRFMPQKMLEEELEFDKILFFDTIFDDIDSILCLQCY